MTGDNNSPEHEVNTGLPDDNETGNGCGCRGEESNECACAGPAEKDTGSLTEEVEALRQEKDEILALLQRVQADYDNYRKRMSAEKDEIRTYALFGFISGMIPVMDNLERALEAAKEKDVPETYIEGIEMIQRQISSLLEQQGVKPVEAKGSIFDPRYHEAVMQTDEGGGEPNTVVEELQRGYVMKERVLRPAMVKVYTGNSLPATNENEDRNEG